MVINEKLAACVNFTKINSVYRWQGKLEHTQEFLVVFKTVNKKKKLLKTKIKTLHPFQVPEIAEIEIKNLNKPYLDWLVTSTS